MLAVALCSPAAGEQVCLQCLVSTGIDVVSSVVQGAQAADKVGEADVPESDAAESSEEEADEDSASLSGAEGEEDEDAQG